MSSGLPGQIIAYSAATVFVGLIVYGLACELYRWWDERAWRRDEQRAARSLPPAEPVEWVRRRDGLWLLVALQELDESGPPADWRWQ